MNLATAKEFIAAQGWTPQEKARRQTGKLYLYAARRNPQIREKTDWRYIAALDDLEAVSEEKILAILNRHESR